MFAQKYEKYQSFLSEIYKFLEVKFSIYLNRRVFVMNEQGYLQKCKLLASVLPWIPALTSALCLVQGSRAKHLLSLCMSEHPWCTVTANQVLFCSIRFKADQKLPRYLGTVLNNGKVEVGVGVGWGNDSDELNRALCRLT